MEDKLVLYGRPFESRLLLGTARYESPQQLAEAVSTANPALLTVSLRRQLPGKKDAGQSFWNLLRETHLTILPNTAGCHSAHDAVTTALLARDLFETNLIKLEVIGDEVNLQPDPFGLLGAASELLNRGFHVLPYCTEDLVIGSVTERTATCSDSRAPNTTMIIDAGIGVPSHACQVMEWGFDGVLLNTAVSRALDPVRMAGAFADAVKAGRGAFLAGPMAVQELAVPSTPEIGRLVLN